MSRYPVDQRIVVPGHIPFGGVDPNAKYGRHAGDDSANPCGTPVYAPTSGKVTGYTKGISTGNVVEIFNGTHFIHVFHLSERLVEPGQLVGEGQLIGRVGTTGLSTGCHIHFGVAKKSVPNITSFDDYINPLEWLKEGEIIVGKITIVGAPASVTAPDGSLHVFARGSDNRLWQKYFNDEGWQPWVSPVEGVSVMSSPTVNISKVGHFHVYATGPAGDLMHWWFDDQWHGAESLGIPKES